MMKNIIVHTFKLDGHLFALPLQAIDQIIRAAALKHIPDLPQHIQGILNYHGKLIPVLNMRHKFGIAPKKLSSDDRIVLLNSKSQQVGILASEVLTMVEIKHSSTLNSTQLTGEKEIDMMANIDAEIALIFNPESLLEQVDISAFKTAIHIQQTKKLIA